MTETRTSPDQQLLDDADAARVVSQNALDAYHDAIRRAHEGGHTMRAIGARLGFSAGRIHQIITDGKAET